MAHEDRARRRAVDREARLSRAPARFRAAYLAALLSLGVAACVTSPHAIRLEERPAENLVRIVNPHSRAVRYYVVPGGGGWFDSPYRIFHVRYRDRDGRIIVLGGSSDGWWTLLDLSSDLPIAVGRAPAERVTLAGRASRDFSRPGLLEWLGQHHHQRPPVAAPCTAQLRLFVRRHPRSIDHVEILGEWHPAPCPTVYTPPT